MIRSASPAKRFAPALHPRGRATIESTVTAARKRCSNRYSVDALIPNPAPAPLPPFGSCCGLPPNGGVRAGGLAPPASERQLAASPIGSWSWATVKTDPPRHRGIPYYERATKRNRRDSCVPLRSGRHRATMRSVAAISLRPLSIFQRLTSATRLIYFGQRQTRQLARWTARGAHLRFGSKRVC